MVVNLLVAQKRLERLSYRRLRIAAVEEAVAVFGPRDIAGLHPLNLVGQLFPGAKLANVDGGPVGSALRLPVREMTAVGRRIEQRQRRRSIGRQLIRIDDDRLRAVQRLAGEHDRLPLQARIVVVVPAASNELRRGHALVIIELGDARLQRVARRQGVQIRERDRVLGVDPLR